MQARHDSTKQYAALFALGIAAATVFNFFMHQSVFLGTLSGIVVALAALYFGREAVKEDIALLKTVPEKLAVMAVILEARVTLALHRFVREARQRRVLARNRMYRTRRIVSA